MNSMKTIYQKTKLSLLNSKIKSLAKETGTSFFLIKHDRSDLLGRSFLLFN